MRIRAGVGTWLPVIVVLLTLGTLVVGCSSTSKEEELLNEIADLDKEQIFARGQELFEEEKYREARRYFSFLYDTFPNDPLGHKAALRVADSYLVKRDSLSLTEARLRYEDFVNRYPNDPDRDYALLKLGEAQTSKKLRPDRDLSRAREALGSFRQLVNLYPSSEYVDEARAKIAEIRATLAEHELMVARYYARTKRWRGAVWRLEYLKESFPEYPRMGEVNTLLTRARSELEAWEARYAQTDDSASSSEKGAEHTSASGGSGDTSATGSGSGTESALDTPDEQR
jgi:outer membrane protein assembly factor BamD